MNMSNITFKIPRLDTSVFKKCSEKIHSRLNIVRKTNTLLICLENIKPIFFLYHSNGQKRGLGDRKLLF